MSNSFNKAIQGMKTFLEDFRWAQEEMKKERNPKLRELIERLHKKFIKEERYDETIQEMKKFLDECDKAEEELNNKQGLKLTELMKQLDNFRDSFRKEAEEYSSRKETEELEKQVSDIKQTARDIASR